MRRRNSAGRYISKIDLSVGANIVRVASIFIVFPHETGDEPDHFFFPRNAVGKERDITYIDSRTDPCSSFSTARRTFGAKGGALARREYPVEMFRRRFEGP